MILESAILVRSRARRLCRQDGRRPRAARTAHRGAPARRDGCGADQVVRRIAAQLDDDALSARADYVVVNIFEEDLEPGSS